MRNVQGWRGLMMGVLLVGAAGCGFSAHPSGVPGPPPPTASPKKPKTGHSPRRSVKPGLPVKKPPAAGSAAWIDTARQVFAQQSGQTPQTPFWFAPNPGVRTTGYTWIALDPIVQDGQLWAGGELHGRWQWWGVPVATGHFPFTVSPPLPLMLYQPAQAAIQLAQGITAPAKTPAILRIQWNTYAGQVLPPIGWQLAPGAGHRVYLTVDFPLKAYPDSAHSLVTLWSAASVRTDRGWFGTITPQGQTIPADPATLTAPASTAAGMVK